MVVIVRIRTPRLAFGPAGHAAVAGLMVAGMSLLLGYAVTPRNSPPAAAAPALEVRPVPKLTPEPPDLYCVFEAAQRSLQCYDAEGGLRLSAEARGEGTRGGYHRRYGNTPPGLYRCDAPKPVPARDAKARSFGPWIVRLVEPAGRGFPYGRDGIGIHGGGLGLRDPYWAEVQGWAPTFGCVRLQNRDLKRFVQMVGEALRRGGTTWFAVIWG